MSSVPARLPPVLGTGRRTRRLPAIGALGLASALGLGCGDRGSPTEPPAPPPAVADTIAPAAAPDAGATAPPAYDPSGAYQLDPDVGPPARPSGRAASRDRRAIQLLLRSTPNGALAAVDGQQLGPTPVLWDGEADGAPHEFTFRLPGHALARYRFIPITGGIVHGSLPRIPDDLLRTEPPAPAPAPAVRPAPRPVPAPPPPVIVPPIDAAMAAEPTAPPDAPLVVPDTSPPAAAPPAASPPAASPPAAAPPAASPP